MGGQHHEDGSWLTLSGHKAMPSGHHSAHGRVLPLKVHRAAQSHVASGQLLAAASGGCSGGMSVDFQLNGITTSPSNVEVNSYASLTVQTSGIDAGRASYEWIISDGGQVISDQTNAGTTIYTSFSHAGNFGVQVIGTVSDYCGNTTTRSTSTTVSVAPYSIDYQLASATASPNPVYVDSSAVVNATATGRDSYAATYHWVVTDSHGNTTGQYDTGNQPTLSLGFRLEDIYTVTVTGTVAINGSVLAQTAVAQVQAKAIRLTDITVTPGSVAQFGINHYKATVDAPGRNPAIQWAYQRVGDANWTNSGNGTLVFDQCENLIGKFNIRATLVSGGVTTQPTATVTVTARPKEQADVSYFDHWVAGGGPKWADATLSVEHPAQGQKTCLDQATIKLTVKKAPGASAQEFAGISSFAFSMAGHLGGKPWQNLVLDRPLTSDNAADPTFTVQFTVGLGASDTFNFEIYAEQPMGWDLWGAGGNPALPSLKHGTLWLNSGSITWAKDNNGVYTTITTAGLGATQAHGIATPSPTIPVRSIDHP